jgi:release factor glutamine methyltransferase
VFEHLCRNNHKVVADLGAGTGAIALALCYESPKPLEIYAVEKSPEAFIFLEKNLKTLSAEKQKNVHLIHNDWEDAELPMLDVIVSNPPYVSLEEYNVLDVGVFVYEPKSALVPQNESDPMSAYKNILELARRKLKNGGALFFEFGPAQEGLWEPLIGDFQFKIFKDLSGKPRFLYAFDFAPKSR